MMKNKCLFLDRDGVINRDIGYAHKIADIEFVPGIFQLCHQYQQLGFLIIIVTNQSGIARGFYNQADFQRLDNWLHQQFLQRGVIIQNSYFCPHHPTNALEEYLIKCECRKPAPGMITKAALEHQIELDKSIFIGDKISDMEAAEAAGINNRILVASQSHERLQVTAQKVDDIVLVKPYIV